MAQTLARVFGQKLAADDVDAMYRQLPTTQVAAPPRADGSEVTYQDLKPSQPKPARNPYTGAGQAADQLGDYTGLGRLMSLKPRQMMSDFYQWGTTPIGATRHAREQGLSHLPYAEQAKAYEPIAAKQQAANKKEWQRFTDDFWQRTKHNPVYNAFRGAGAAFDPKNTGREGAAFMEQMAGPASSPPATPPATGIIGALQQAYKDNPYLVGGAGAGIGALGLYGAYNMMRKRRQRQQSQFSRARYPQIIN